MRHYFCDLNSELSVHGVGILCILVNMKGATFWTRFSTGKLQLDGIICSFHPKQHSDFRRKTFLVQFLSSKVAGPAVPDTKRRTRLALKAVKSLPPPHQCPPQSKVCRSTHPVALWIRLAKVAYGISQGSSLNPSFLICKKRKLQACSKSISSTGSSSSPP